MIPFAERSTHGNAVGVPGTVKGLEAALDKWGTRSMKELIEPSIQLAEDGFEIDSVLANAIDDHQGKLKKRPQRQFFFQMISRSKKEICLSSQVLQKHLNSLRKKEAKRFMKEK